MHDGHRMRLKERFLKEGLDSFSEVQVLELALFYCIPRKDTNPIAHALLAHFGGLSQVLEAPVEELMRIPGMGETSAAFLHQRRFIKSFRRLALDGQSRAHGVLHRASRRQSEG